MEKLSLGEYEMTYQKSCPNCRMIVRGGHGSPMKRLGTPIVRCEFCGYEYLDNDILEWSIIPIYRKIGFCWANNRWAIVLLAAMVGMVMQNTTMLLILVLISTVACTVYALVKGQKSLPESSARTSDPNYIQRLIKSGYEVASRFDHGIEN